MRKEYELKLEGKIYYTGDQANPSGFGVIKNIRNDEWGTHIDIEMEDRELFGKHAIKHVSRLCFSPGIGQRFMTIEQWQDDREEKFAKMEEYIAKHKITNEVTP